MNKEAIFQIIVGHSRKVPPALADYAFQYNEPLAELGINSMDRAAIIMTLESLGLKIPLLAVARAGNLGELAEMLYKQLQGR